MDQNFQYSSSIWSVVNKEIPQETLGLEMAPQYAYVDIHGAEIAELRERVRKLEERLEQTREQQIIPINFFETEKLKSKRAFNVLLEYNPEDNLYVVDCPELNIYGEGRDETSAIADFKIALQESFFSLKKDKKKLSPPLAEEWMILSNILEEK